MRARVEFFAAALAALALSACGGAHTPALAGDEPDADAGIAAGSGGTAEPAGGSPVRSGKFAERDGLPAVDPSWKYDNARPADAAADRAKKPFDIEALYRVRRVGSPAWSPEGNWILFTVATYDLAAGSTVIDIYRVAPDGSGLRQMTRQEGVETDPIWAPDGRSFAFISYRKDGAQLWQMPIDGGEPRRLTEVHTGIEQPVWSPDGKRIAFASSVYPEHGADQQANKQTMDDAEKSPIKAHVADHLLYRHWTAWADGRRSHILVIDLETEKLVDVTPGDFDSPVFQLGGERGFDFSPDSAEICFASNREQADARAWTTDADLFVVPVSGGEARNITAANDGFDGLPAYSPDGRYIAFLRQAQPGYEADRFALALYDRRTGEVEIVTDGFDDWVVDFAWSADSRRIVFQAPLEGRYPLLELDLATREIERFAAIPSVREFDLGADGRLAFTYNAVAAPDELFVAAADGGGVKRLTSFNDQVVEEHDVRPLEEIWVEGSGGTKLQVFVVKPHGFVPGKRYPAILNVHGGPQGQWSDSFRGDWQIYPGAGYVVAFPNPHGSTGRGQAYTAAISGDWGGKVYEDVMAVADALEQLDYVDPERIGAMGWSYGGYMMNWLLGHTNRFEAIASMMGIYDLTSFYLTTEELWFPEWDLGIPWKDPETYRKWSPSTHVENFETPTLIISGEKDFRIPFTESLALFTALRRQGVESRLIVFPDDGHWPSWVKSMPLYYAAHLDWFHRYLGGDPCPYDLREMVRGRAFGEKGEGGPGKHEAKGGKAGRRKGKHRGKKPR